MIKIYSTNFDQCHITKNYEDQCRQFRGFPAQLGGFSDSLSGQFLAVAGCGFWAISELAAGIGLQRF